MRKKGKLTMPIEVTSTGPVAQTLMLRLRGGAEVVVDIHEDPTTGRVNAELVEPAGLPFYGTGETLNEAIVNLTTALFETRDRLERDSHRLGPVPARRLRALRYLFAPQIEGRRRSGTPSFKIGSESTSAHLTAA